MIFIDISYGKSIEEQKFLEEMDKQGIIYSEPVDAKETGCDINKMITESSFYLFVLGNWVHDLRLNTLSTVKQNDIPYRYILLSEDKNLMNLIPIEEQRYVTHFYKDGDRIKLYATIKHKELYSQKKTLEQKNKNIMRSHQKNDIYIIHKRTDNEIAKKMRESLEAKGNRVFDEKNIPAGGFYTDDIRNAILNSKYCIVLLSDGCLSSGSYIQEEIAIALDAKIGNKDLTIIPVNINGYISGDNIKNFTSRIPTELLKYKWLNFSLSNYSAFIEELESIIEMDKVENCISCDIFLAYPKLDKDAGDKVCEILRRNGFSVWRADDGLYPGNNVQDEIKTAIKNAKVFLLIESKWSKESEWIKQELYYARSINKNIINVLTDNKNGLLGERRMSFKSNSLELGTYFFEEKLLSSVLSKGCISNTTIMYNKGVQLYEDINTTPLTALNDNNNADKERECFKIFLRATELGNEDSMTYIDRMKWGINLIEAISHYHEIYANFVNDLRTSIYNKGMIIAEDSTLPDIPQRGRGMEGVAYKFMKRAINLGYNGGCPENYSWYFIDEKDFEKYNIELGISSKYSLDKINNIVSTTSEAGILQNPNLSKKNTDNLDSPSKYNTDEVNKDEKTPENIAKLQDTSLNNKIFISYKRLDKDIVFPIVDEIYKRTGIKCWIDLEGIESGDQFQNVIINAIDESDIFIFMLSKNFIAPFSDPQTGVVNPKKQTFPEKEFMYALHRDKRLVPVSIDGTMPYDCKWLYFNCGGVDCIDYSDIDQRNKFFKNLASWFKIENKSDEATIPNDIKTFDPSKNNERDNTPEFYDESVELQLAWLDYESGNYKEALKQFLLIAKDGSANALNAVGVYYYEGKACTRNYQQAFSYFQKAANLGYASAMRNLGDCYNFGHGVSKNLEKAIYWYREAADKKNMKAIFKLAECLEKFDTNKYNLYQEAALMGDEKASEIIERINNLYNSGYKSFKEKSDHEDIEKLSYSYLRQAAEYGHPKALELIRDKAVWTIDIENL